MNPMRPGHQTWAALLDEAVKYKKKRPWDLTGEDEILMAVHPPKSGETLYAVVLGGAQEVFGLAVYPGESGLSTYLRTREIDFRERDFIYSMRTLLVCFVDRDELSEEDLGLIHSLGRGFRGAHAWPQFRSYEPGYVETLPDTREARSLKLALEAVASSVERVVAEHAAIKTDKSAHAVPSLRADHRTGQWNVGREFIHPPEEKLEVPPVDELRIQRLKKRPRIQEIWEGACYWIPSVAVEGDKKPFFPLMAIWVNHNGGSIIGHDLGTPSQGIAVLQESLLSLLEKGSGLPEKILVLSGKALKILSPVTAPLGIDLERVEQLYMLQEAVQAMMGAFTDTGEGEFPDPGVFDEIFDEVDSVIDENEDLLNLFSAWLSTAGLADETIERHLRHIDLYINIFLLSEDEYPSFGQGIFRLDSFFSQWLSQEMPEFGPAARKRIIASLNKFYAFLHESGILSHGELSTFRQTVRARKSDWLR